MSQAFWLLDAEDTLTKLFFVKQYVKNLVFQNNFKRVKPYYSVSVVPSI